MSKPRFGPGREAALSLDNLPVEPAEPEPEFTAAVDWDTVVRNAKLTRFEAGVFRRHWKGGVPLAELHTALSCTLAQAERAYRTVLRKLRTIGWNAGFTYKPIRNSLRLTYCEKLPGGHRVRSLSQLGPDFAEIMNAEKCFGLFSQRNQTDTATQRRTAKFCPRITGAKMSKVESIDLAGQFAAARKQWGTLTGIKIRLGTQLKELLAERWATRKGAPAAKIEAAKLAAIEEAIAALVDDREPDPKIMAGAESLDIQTTAIQKKLEIAEAACASAARTVAELAEKIRLADLPAKLARLKPQAVELRRAFDAVVELNAIYRASCAAEGVSVDPFADLPGDIRANAGVALHQLSQVERLLISYGRRKAAA